ncbi:hypothetical protein BpHYR1_036262 [Brachionus plicatilis]|uniref:Uncharacterized protein n=1 Tax=Brachionus plicatilis TaxID=10195 RepID=A0A3M7PFA3_BRAPC|nr:hypothetical protein BpHYR1_036262 [Brachionus plicatilis]
MFGLVGHVFGHVGKVVRPRCSAISAKMFDKSIILNVEANTTSPTHPTHKTYSVNPSDPSDSSPSHSTRPTPPIHHLLSQPI